MRFHIPFYSMIMRLFGAALLLICAMLAACAGREVPPPAAVMAPPAVTAPPSAPVPELIYRETGTAAWYGLELQGRKTASGEVFDMHGLSAAHRTLPLGTAIRVTNLDNSKTITVKINDRGPFIKSRILDLSYGAAQELGFVAQGTVRVTVETLETVRAQASYTVQAAVFTEEENARLLKERLQKKFELVMIVPRETNIARLYCVRVGAYGSQERAEKVAAKLTREGLEPIVLRKD